MHLQARNDLVAEESSDFPVWDAGGPVGIAAGVFDVIRRNIAGQVQHAPQCLASHRKIREGYPFGKAIPRPRGCSATPPGFSRSRPPRAFRRQLR